MCVREPWFSTREKGGARSSSPSRNCWCLDEVLGIIPTMKNVYENVMKIW